ncbi:Smr/MutS family protein [Tanticharoenia sakaeratensis]|uniref:Smr/MutS family protein n=1 Tax=Tanticharoenia sakaeratensis TaxID=444053 RepID=UPI0006623686|nr:Smr/MutS family protein [Tanticharoenia sakaeratensis]
MARRTISEQETLLWDAVMRDVQPLRRARSKPVTPVPDPTAAIAPPASAPARAPRLPPPWSPDPVAPPRPVVPSIGHRAPGLDDTSWRALSRGTMRVQRRLDLHGHRAQSAFERLHRFLLTAARDGVRCVEIVTGLGSGAEGGVLRRELPHWLDRPDLGPLILAVVHPHTRNQGSVRILLRRAGRPR